MASVSGRGHPRRRPRCSYRSPDKAARAEQAGWPPEIGTRPAGLRDRPGHTCDHRGAVVVGALGEAAAFRRVREGKGEADEVPSVRTTPSALKSEGSNGPWLTVEKSRVVAAALALFSEPHGGDASSTGLLGGVADAGPAPRTMLAAATTSVHTSRERRTARFPKFILVASRRGASFGDNGWTDIACGKIGVTSAWWSGQLVA